MRNLFSVVVAGALMLSGCAESYTKEEWFAHLDREFTPTQDAVDSVCRVYREHPSHTNQVLSEHTIHKPDGEQLYDWSLEWIKEKCK